MYTPSIVLLFISKIFADICLLQSNEQVIPWWIKFYGAKRNWKIFFTDISKTAHHKGQWPNSSLCILLNINHIAALFFQDCRSSFASIVRNVYKVTRYRDRSYPFRHFHPLYIKRTLRAYDESEPFKKSNYFQFSIYWKIWFSHPWKDKVVEK